MTQELPMGRACRDGDNQRKWGVTCPWCGSRNDVVAGRGTNPIQQEQTCPACGTRYLVPPDAMSLKEARRYYMSV